MDIESPHLPVRQVLSLIYDFHQTEIPPHSIWFLHCESLLFILIPVNSLHTKTFKNGILRILSPLNITML